MIITITIGGNKYTSAETDEVTADEFSERLFDNMSDLDSFKMQLKTGGYLLLGRDAVQRAQMFFID